MKNPWIKNKLEITEVAPDIEQVIHDKVVIPTISGKVPKIPNTNGGCPKPVIHTYSVINELTEFDPNATDLRCTTFQTPETMHKASSYPYAPGLPPSVSFTHTLSPPFEAVEVASPDNLILYSRELKVGPFTFKDAGYLGTDIFCNGEKVGWINQRGEEDLKGWLNSKPPQIEEKEINFLSDKFWIPGELSLNAIRRSIEGKPYKETQGYNTKIISNEAVGGSGWGGDQYAFEHDNVVPGSVIFTSYVNCKQTSLWGETVLANGRLCKKDYGDHQPKNVVLDVVMNYERGIMTAAWSENPPKDNFLLVCYEYKITTTNKDTHLNKV